MNFGLSQDQILLRDTIDRFLDEQCPTTRVRQVMDGPTGHDPELWSGLVELGVTGLYVPADHDGAGLELLDLALAAEEIGYNCTPGPVLGNALAQIALVRAATRHSASDGCRSSSTAAASAFALGEPGHLGSGEARPRREQAHRQGAGALRRAGRRADHRGARPGTDPACGWSKGAAGLRPRTTSATT
jgi:alkylation response protein AidB-like acyl-CoA dehydrogenase